MSCFTSSIMENDEEVWMKTKQHISHLEINWRNSEITKISWAVQNLLNNTASIRNVRRSISIPSILLSFIINGCVCNGEFIFTMHRDLLHNMWNCITSCENLSQIHKLCHKLRIYVTNWEYILQIKKLCYKLRKFITNW